MNKWLLLAVLAGMFFTKNVMAAGFNLQKIGNLDVAGKMSSHWWYSGRDSTMIGEAEPGAEVSVDIDGTVSTVTADDSGSWVFAGEMTEGDHQIKLTSGGSEISFTLTLGNENVDWAAVESGSGEALPAAGNPLPTMILIISGLSLAWFGRQLFLVNNKN